MGDRLKFFRSSYQICPSCDGKDLKSVDNCEGCRHNGDGYGTTVYTCNSCNWSTSFLYDEYDAPYHYETRNWAFREEDEVHVPYVPTPDKVLGTYMRTKYDHLRTLVTDDDLRFIMDKDDFSRSVIDQFLASGVNTRQTTVVYFKSEEMTMLDKWVVQKLALLPYQEPPVIVEPVVQSAEKKTSLFSRCTKGSKIRPSTAKSDNSLKKPGIWR
jgi:hypothetical protein